MTSAATTNDVLPVTTGAYELAELHGVLVNEHEWRKREGLD
jgi:hypothetical protein